MKDYRALLASRTECYIESLIRQKIIGRTSHLKLHACSRAISSAKNVLGCRPAGLHGSRLAVIGQQQRQGNEAH